MRDDRAKLFANLIIHVGLSMSEAKGLTVRELNAIHEASRR